MASSSGTTTTTSSGSSLLQNSCSEEDLQQVMDQRKRKRMISNRESARRSRMRKQKHLDDLMAQLAELRKENNHIIASMSVATQNYLNIEAQNSVLRAQMAELTNRLQSLNEITSFLDANNGTNFGTGEDPTCNVFTEPAADFFMFNLNMNMNMNMNNPLNYHLYTNQQPIMASADMLQY